MEFYLNVKIKMHTNFKSYKNALHPTFKDKKGRQQQGKRTMKNYWRFTRRGTVETYFVWQRRDSVRSVREL